MLDAYERATREEGRGALVYEGEMIDEATRKMAASIVHRGRAIGMDQNTPMKPGPIPRGKVGPPASSAGGLVPSRGDSPPTSLGEMGRPQSLESPCPTDDSAPAPPSA